jgi:hypothetical protein
MLQRAGGEMSTPADELTQVEVVYLLTVTVIFFENTGGLWAL